MLSKLEFLELTEDAKYLYYRQAREAAYIKKGSED